MKELWVEKYRPNTLDGYVFKDDRQKSQIEGWIKDGSIPHLMFSGNAGVGKTTLAKILVNTLNLQWRCWCRQDYIGTYSNTRIRNR